MAYVRKQFMIDEAELAALHLRCPLVSQAALVRAAVKIALEIDEKTLRDALLAAVGRFGANETKDTGHG